MIQQIIKEYKSELKLLNHSGFSIVLNQDWDRVTDDLKVIYCGDNPGKEEKIENKYFVGKAGKELDTFIKVNNLMLDVNDSQTTFFNKTSFHSNSTSDIKKSSENINKDIYKSIELTVACLYKIWKFNGVKIFVFGVNKSSYIVKSFKEILSKIEDESFLNSIIVLNHPSHNSLFGTIGEFALKNFEKDGELKLNYTDLINGIQKQWF